jgi:hypothetical protein
MKTLFVQAAAACGPEGSGRIPGFKGHSPVGPALPKWDAHFAMSYERYPRLDPLSKMAALAAEKVLDPFAAKPPMGLIMTTQFGCQEADWDYYRTAGGNSPELASPKIFPYTLPSAGLAEISMRFKLTGPALVLWGQLDVSPALSQIYRWLAQGEIEAGLVVAADARLGEAAGLEAWAFLLSGQPGPWRLENRGNSWEALAPHTLADALDARHNLELPGWRVLCEEDAGHGLNPGVETKDHRHL